MALRSMPRAAALCLLALCLAWGCKEKKGAPAPPAASPPQSPAAAGEAGEPPAAATAKADEASAPASAKPEAAAAAPAGPGSGAPVVYSSVENVPAAGIVEGKVLIEGAAPPNEPLTISEEYAAAHPAAAAHCRSRNLKNDDVVVLGGGLANAVVEIRGITRGKRRLKQALVRAANCRYQPRVSLAPRGKALILVNEDPFEYHLRIRKPGTGAFFDSLLSQDDKVPTNEALISGVYELSCDLQPWLKGYVHVVGHPYFAVTGLDGSFRIEDVPPGKHPARVWHEQLGERTAEVDVKDGLTAHLVFRYKQ